MAEQSDPTQNSKSRSGAESYDASKIQKLEGLEGVRRRPDMYIGDTNERGLHHCVFEVVDNSVDEALAGFATAIKVSIHLDGSCSVEDDGRGIPVDIHPVYKIPALELVLTNLHAGGKFGKGAYQVSGGLHGVGAKCVNAVSEWLEAEVRRNGKVYQMRFAQGKTTQKMAIIGDTKKTGTKITFRPDPEIFLTTREFQYEILARRLRELAFLNPGIRIELDDERSQKSDVFFFKDGITEFVRFLNQNKNVLHDKPITFSDSVGDEADPAKAATVVDVSLQYNDSYNDQVFAYANSIYNLEGGTHLSGFRTALTRVINNYAKANNLIKEKDPSITGRRHPRRPGRGHLGEGPGAPLRRPDQDQALELRGGRDRPEGGRREAEVLSRGTHGRRETHHRQDPAFGAGPRGRQEGAGDHPKGGPLGRRASGQARRLFRARSGPDRALHRRGRFRRRFGQAGPGPPLPGHPPPQGKTDQQREGANRQGPQQRGDPNPHHRDRHGHRRRTTRRTTRPSTSSGPATTRSSS